MNDGILILDDSLNHNKSKNMDAKETADYLLKEINLQTISQEYAGAI